MESIVSSSTDHEQSYVEVPYAYGMLRVTGDEAVLQELYDQARATQHQAAVEALGRPFKTIAGYLGNVASTVAGNIKIEAKMAIHDTVYGTNFREERHQFIDEQRNLRFAASIGLIAVEK